MNEFIEVYDVDRGMRRALRASSIERVNDNPKTYKHSGDRGSSVVLISYDPHVRNIIQVKETYDEVMEMLNPKQKSQDVGREYD